MTTLAVVSAAMIAAAPAMAADLRVPVRSPAAVVAQAFNWSGFYIGAHGGGAWSHKHWDFDFFGDSGRHRADGAFAGGQVGFNWQTGMFVFGVEGEGSWADLRSSHDCHAFARCHTRVDWLASVTGRAGIAFDNWLVYAKGGWAWVGERHHIDEFGIRYHTGDVTRDGYTIGGGVEVGFWNNWSAKVEYMYADFGRHRHGLLDDIGVSFEDARVKQELHTVKFGVNYRFGWGGPVVARY